jgi:hypothetical protein
MPYGCFKFSAAFSPGERFFPFAHIGRSVRTQKLSTSSSRRKLKTPRKLAVHKSYWTSKQKTESDSLVCGYARPTQLRIAYLPLRRAAQESVPPEGRRHS